MDTEPIQPPKIEQPNQNISPEITFSVEGKPTSIEVTQVNDLFNEIRTFNRQFSVGSMMAQFLRSHFMTPENESIPRDINQVGQEAQELTASGIDLVNKPTLEKLGLGLEPVHGKNARIFTGDQSVGEGEMRVNIQESGKFLSFLRALDPKQVSHTELRENLHGLSDILAQQIYDTYDLKQPSDEALQLFGSLENITNEYKRLQIGGVDRLETYLNHAKQGDLREWILIEHQNLLSNPGESFGPGDWQEDSTPKYLKDHWDRALETLRMTQENPKARDLYNKLFPHLAKCAKISLDGLKNLNYLPAEQKAESERILQEINQTFENPPHSQSISPQQPQ